MQPRVSVVMAVRDAAAHVAKAIASVLDQTLRDFEFVIVDDGSTDQTFAIVRRFAEADDRIRTLRCTGVGLPRALNAGIEAARAPLIARMDGDDVCLPERLERQVAYLRAHDECVTVGTSLIFIDADGDPFGRYRMAVTHAEILERFVRDLGFGIAHPSAVFRKAMFDLIGGYDERYRTAQDLDLFLRLSERGRLANLPEFLLQLRMHPDQSTVRHREEQQVNAVQIVGEYCARHGKNPPVTAGRPPAPRASDRVRTCCDTATRAMRGGFPRTALKYLRRAVLTAPASPYLWITALRVLRDYAAPTCTAAVIRNGRRRDANTR